MGPSSEMALPERATSTRGLDVRAVPDRLMASWRRSEEYGVSLESVDPVFAGTGPSDTLFFQCGQEVLGALAETLANEPVSLMLTDAEGLVLERRSGDSSLLRAWTRSTSRRASPSPSGRRGPTGSDSPWRTGCPRWCGRSSTTARACASTPVRPYRYWTRCRVASRDA